MYHEHDILIYYKHMNPKLVWWPPSTNFQLNVVFRIHTLQDLHLIWWNSYNNLENISLAKFFSKSHIRILVKEIYAIHVRTNWKKSLTFCWNATLIANGSVYQGAYFKRKPFCKSHDFMRFFFIKYQNVRFLF